MFEDGEGVIVNSQYTIRWYLKASNDGRVDAENTLGNLCADSMSEELSINYQEAARWLAKASVSSYNQHCHLWVVLYPEVIIPIRLCNVATLDHSRKTHILHWSTMGWWVDLNISVWLLDTGGIQKIKDLKTRVLDKLSKVFLTEPFDI